MPKGKWLREFTLGVGAGRHHQSGFRGPPSLLNAAPSRVLNFKRGVPVFSSTVDTIKQFATGNRQYKGASKRNVLKTDFDHTSYHRMVGKFQFHITGLFPRGGTAYEDELFRVASDLGLVGFIKARSGYALGHFQGDVFSLSHMRKWIDSRQQETGEVSAVHFFEDSYGLPELRYNKLECIKDWRSPIRRRQHMSVLQEEAKWDELEKSTRERDSLTSQTEEATHVRTY
jgi:hypothetical protein